MQAGQRKRSMIKSGTEFYFSMVGEVTKDESRDNKKK